ncbi:hypothetical protein AZI85_03155 [Bdellovibrio bacteriovorus]|uniref:Uncharacterized protein n=1 Tax=Bdellovibrio bacteriovorus TaxID=959 RepID=A0A150WKI0_BDEBC|nr:hypothetical protein [Bdellovibrio bacteriovorus]KYG64434.1 hypothetical protein AZI85_03155 [Bdellovibrio bacteriovorus]
MSNSSRKGQLELGINRSPEKDRNFHLGGRSFYFFDFDDNIAFLTTPLILFHKTDRHEVKISSGDFAQYHQSIGKSGPYADYDLDFCDTTGTFRNFRDHHIEDIEKLQGKKQIFVQDVAEALGFPDFQWKGPSWECFYHATFNQRPLSVITARGHHPETLKDGIRVFVQNKLLPLEPNYLSVYPVSHKETRALLGDAELKEGTAELKQRAIRASVEKAIETYGYNPHHRFGMSDDDPKNIQLIAEEMTRLKARFPEMSFFLIETQHGNFVKHEIKLGGLRGEKVENLSQLSFFEEDRQKS